MARFDLQCCQFISWLLLFLVIVNCIYTATSTSASAATVTTTINENLPIVKSLFPTKGSELGGTKISLKGSYLNTIPNIQCCFNETRINAESISDEEIICYTPSSPPGRVFVSLCSYHEQQEEEEAANAPLGSADAQSHLSFFKLEYEYTIMATVFSLSPLSGSGGNNVEIIGSGFTNASTLCCRFNTTVVSAAYVSDSRVNCISPTLKLTSLLLPPRHELPSSVLVTVSNNGVDVEGDWASVMFDYTPPLEIISIVPNTAPSSGGTNLFIRGNGGFHQNSAVVTCKMHDYIVNATVLSMDEIVCQTPNFNSVETMTVNIAVSINGGEEYIDASGIQSQILVHPPSEILSVTPKSVPETGHSLIHIVGKAFYDSPHLACQFGNVTVPATWVSNSSLHCRVTPSKSGVVNLTITTNGQSSGWSTNTIPFRFDNAVTVSNILPTSGPITGGTAMIVYGTGLLANSLLLCRFGNVSVYANIVYNDTTAMCVVPPINSSPIERIVSVDISVNDGYNFALGPYFEYKELHQISEILPRLGPSTGNTKVIIHGKFSNLDHDNTKCHFRFDSFNMSTSVEKVTNMSVTCLTPAVQLSSSVDFLRSYVEVFDLNDASMSPLSERAPSFVHYARSTLKSIHPTQGSELGGTNITITGHFMRSNYLTCKFGPIESYFVYWVNRNTVICTIPPARIDFLRNPVVKVTILINGEDDEGLSLPFKYLVASHISSINPSFGSISGGTNIVIEGEGFLVSRASNPYCLFGNTFAEANILSTTRATCISPLSKSVQSIVFGLTFESGRETIASSENFTYTKDPIIHSIDPQMIVANENTQVHLIGENFFSLINSKAFCSIGNYTFKAKVENESLLTFYVQSIKERIVTSVKVSLNGNDFFSGPVLSIFPSPVISKIYPNFSNEDGGTPISIEGSGFYNNPNLTCIFHFNDLMSVHVPVQYESFSLVRCITPPTPTSFQEEVDLELSLNGFSSSSNPSVKIRYFTRVTILSLKPANCPKSGGTDISIHGMGFSRQSDLYYCKFEESTHKPIYVAATYELDSLIKCRVPPSQNKNTNTTSSVKLSVMVQNDDVLFETSGEDFNSVKFLYFEDVRVKEAIPESASIEGESMIEVQGENFFDSFELLCSFTFEDQKYVRPAKFVSSEIVLCRSPTIPDRILRTDTVSLLQVSNNGFDFSKEGIPFHHRQPFQLLKTEPTLFSEIGGTDIAVFGKHFFHERSISCVFSSVLITEEMTTIATYISPSLLKCPSPPLHPGLYHLTINSPTITALNKIDVSIHDQIRIIQISPKVGPTYGSTEVSVSGLNFPNTTSLQCKFGNIPTKALHVSTTQIICITPMQNFNIDTIVEVHVSGNGQEFSNTRHISFAYKSSTTVELSSSFYKETLEATAEGQELSYRRVEISEIQPPFCTVNGGQKLSVIGSGFVSHPDAACRFGVIITSAVTITPERLECMIPSASNPGQIVVDVTLNGKSWTDNGIKFEYISPVEIFHLRPMKLPLYGGTVVHVSGSNMDLSHKLSCKFGKAIVDASVLSNKFLTCVSPGAVIPGIMPFDIVVDHISLLSHAPMKIEVVQQFYFSLHPKFGPKRGHTPLLLDFEETFDVGNDHFVCEFMLQRKILYHTKLDLKDEKSSAYSCLTPNITKDMGKLSFEKTSADFVFSNVNIKSLSGNFSMTRDIFPSFTFKDSPSKVTISPHNGEVDGGTTVSLNTAIADGLWLNSSALVCKFGITTVVGVWKSSQSIECIAPPSAKAGHSNVSLAVAENGIDFFYMENFLYHPRPSIISMNRYYSFPNKWFDTEIKVTNMVFSDEPTCKFDSITYRNYTVSSAVIINQTMVKCSFLSTRHETFALSVSSNGQEYSLPSMIQVVPIPHIKSVAPLLGISGQASSIAFRGDNFVASMTWTCVMGKDKSNFANSPKFISISTIQCEFQCPEVRKKESFQVVLRTDNEFDVSKVNFWCHPRPKVTNIFPTDILAHFRQNVTISGIGFIFGQQLTCVFSGVFGTLHAKALFVDEESIVCETPSLEYPDTLWLELTYDGNNLIAVKKQIQTLPPISMYKVKNQTLFAGGIIKIEGDFHVNNTKGINCRIGGYIGRYAEYENKHMLHCYTPIEIPLQTYFSVQLLYHLTVIETQQAMINVVGFPQIKRISPSKNIRFFPNQVVVTGDHFDVGSKAQCRFGNLTSPANVLSKEKILCESPLSNEAVAVPLTVIMDNVSALNEQMYEYLDPCSISKIIPSSGSIKGGTLVTIFGSNFDSAVKSSCLFGRKISEMATVLSGSAIQCISPSFIEPQYMIVSIVNAKTGDIISLSNETSRYYAFDEGSEINLQEEEIKRNIILKGSWFYHPPFETKRSIILKGNWFYHPPFENLLNPTCSFNHVEVPAIFKENLTVVCNQPHNVHRVSNMTLRFSLNGVDYLKDTIIYQHEEEIFLNNISPNNGPISGGTHVSLNGMKVKMSTKKIQCRFGDYPPMFATFDSRHQKVVCQTPAVSVPSATKLNLKFGALGSWIDSGLYFEFFEEINVEKVTPLLIDQSGGDMIYIQGSGFKSHDKMCCHFADNIQVKADYINQTLITCLTPSFHDLAKASGTVTFAVSSRENYKVDTSILLNFKVRPIVLHLDPFIGPSKGGTEVLVNGRGFQSGDTFLCWFGDFATVAKFISITSISCNSSLFFLEEGTVASVNFYVSLKNYKMVEVPENLKFHYYNSWVAPDIQLLPSSGPFEGRTTVKMIGQSIRDLYECLKHSIPNPKVRFGHEIIDGVIHDGIVQFLTPDDYSSNITSANFVPIALSVNGGFDFIPSPHFQMYSKPIVKRIFPQLVIYGFHPDIKVEGSSFPIKHNLLCQIGSEIFEGRFITSSLVSCPLSHLPQMEHEETILSVSISFNGQDFSSNYLHLLVQLQPSILNITPRYVSNNGGTMVSLEGSNLMSIKKAGCSICLTRSRPSMKQCSSVDISGNKLTFNASSGFGNNVEVAVGCGFDTFQMTNLRLSYLPTPELHEAVFHVEGTGDGVLPVNVKGKNFLPEMSAHYCLFESGSRSNEIHHLLNETIKALYVNRTSLTCHVHGIDNWIVKEENTLMVKIKRSVDSSISNFIDIIPLLDILPRHWPYNSLVSEFENNEEIEEHDQLNSDYFLESFDEIEGQNLKSHMLQDDIFRYLSFGRYEPIIEHIYNPMASFRGEESTVYIHGKGLTKLENQMDCFFGNKSTPVFIVNESVAECKVPSIYSLFDTLHLNSQSMLNVDFRLASKSTGLNMHITATKIEYTNITGRQLPLENYSDLKSSSFIYNEDVELISITPKLCPSTGNTYIRISGKGFQNVSQLSCKVGIARPRRAIFINSKGISCPIPNATEALDQNFLLGENAQNFQMKSFVSVSNDGNHFHDIFAQKNLASLIYFKQPVFFDVSPTSGNTGKNIYLYAKVLPYLDNPLCRFGQTIVKADILRPSTILCKAPPIEIGMFRTRVAVSISVNGFNFFETGFHFSYVSTSVANFIEPVVGPTIGGNVVRVLGSNFENNTLACNFGDSFANAIYISNNILECRAPKNIPRMVNFSLIEKSDKLWSNNNRDDHPSLSYRYLDYYKIEDVVPNFGFATGNTTVTIIGQNFVAVEGLVCLFGDNYSNAILMSSREIKCLSPQQNTLSMTVEIRIGILIKDTITYLSAVTTKTFTYVELAHIDNIYPSRGFLSGGDKVKVIGKNFAPPYYEDDVICSFGGEKSNGDWISSTEIECLTPSMPPSGKSREIQRVKIVIQDGKNRRKELSYVLKFDGKTSNKIADDVTGEQLKSELSSLPSIGDVEVEYNMSSDDTTNVVILTYDIRFTTLGVPSNTGLLPLIDMDVFSPLHGVNYTIEKVQGSCCEVKLSLNHLDYFGGRNGSIVAFTFDSNMIVTEVSPSHGPKMGGTLVNVFTGGRLNSLEGLQGTLFCVFGSNRVKANLDNNNQISCVTPTFPTSGKTMATLEIYSEVAGHGTFIQSKAGFTYVNNPTINETFPRFLSASSKRLFLAVVNVYGDNFVDSRDLKCHYYFHSNPAVQKLVSNFTIFTQAVFQNETHIQCINYNDIDFGHLAESATLYITTNGIDLSKGFNLDIVEQHSINKIVPNSGPRSGGTVVMIHGSNFVDVESLSCRFGNSTDSIVRGIYLSSKTLKCIVPHDFYDTSITGINIYVTNNGDNYVSSWETFRFYHDFNISLVKPSVGPSDGGTHLILRLDEHFYGCLDFNCVCKFNETQVPAIEIESGSNQAFTCISPPSFSHGGLVPFEFSINGYDFTTSSSKFLYLPGIPSDSLVLTPSHGPNDGGTLVKIGGLSQSKFLWRVEENIASCRFGNVVVPVEEVSPLGDFIACRSPNVLKNGNLRRVNVEFSLTGAHEDFTSFGIVFTYDETISVSELNPDYGSMNGGTFVLIHGGPFVKLNPSEIMCRFGDNISKAHWKSSDTIGCVAPASEEIIDLDENGFCRVSVSVNGADFSPHFRLFHYIHEAKAKELIPGHGFGGSSIVVVGENFNANLNLQCHFDASEIPALGGSFHSKGVTVTKFINRTHLLCIAPPPLSSGYVSFFISIDGVETSNKRKTLWYRYDEQPALTQIVPGSGPAVGNFSLQIYGGPFGSPHYEYMCKFGRKTVVASYVALNQITCNAPSQVPGVYDLRITQNGQDFSEDFERIQFYDTILIRHISPYSGPTFNAGTQVALYGSNFLNSSAAMCKFHGIIVPADYVSENEIICEAPTIFSDNELEWQRLSDHESMPGLMMFPTAHSYPLYSSRLITVEVSMNGQDFTTLNNSFLYQNDIIINRLILNQGSRQGGTPVFIQGTGFVNSTYLSCRFGHHITNGTFITRNIIVCFSPPYSIVQTKHTISSVRTSIIKKLFDDGPDQDESKVYVEISNNALDFTDYKRTFQYLHVIPSGSYHFGTEKVTILDCPRGSYCNGSANFTLCPKGTYQPSTGQSKCIRCPIGFMCPQSGLPVPRICPAGFVCDVTGIENAEQPCPAGFYCPAGTVTSSTYCGSSNVLRHGLSTSMTLAERSTIRKGYIPSGLDFIIGGRYSTCWDNSTNDFGLQASDNPSFFWDEIRALPLDSQGSSAPPLRGRFCQDDSCLSIQPSLISSPMFDQSTFRPQRPLPCPSGTYCHPGSSTNDTSLSTSAKPKVCDGRNYCPEGSTTPAGFGDCPLGYFCRFGKKSICPIGTFCPFSNMWDPLACQPGTFNYMIGQINCTECPVGHFCNGYGRIDPALCHPGFVCSKVALSSPNIRCPPGYYCPSGTQTSDPFRNDTTLRPYPCSPGTYCLSGTGSLTVVRGNFSHAQPCPPGFFCEAASTSAKGSGLCPAGYFCPKGTATPIPTPKGHHSELTGTIQATKCLPGFYAPTIESSECIPCPPGTSCEDEGTFLADICPPGSYRSTIEGDGITCQTCPQGSWSKNWNLRDKGECTICPPGLSCPLDGMTNPCSKNDLPTPYEPVLNLNGKPVLQFKFSSASAPPPFSVDECLQLNFSPQKVEIEIDHHFFYGELIPPYIDILGRGPHLRVTDGISTKYSENAKCYRNLRRYGSIVYERMAQYHGPQYDIQNRHPHQGYGVESILNPMFSIAPPDDSFMHDKNYFYGEGRMYIDLPRSIFFDPTLNCTHGFNLMNSTLVRGDRQIVYTSELYDYEGGVDVEICSFYDPSLDCFIDPEYQAHPKGQCCSISRWKQRAIFQSSDQYYPGTCEADIICSKEDLITEAISCQDGFVCDENTTAQSSTSMVCPPGYICPFGTTPDKTLFAPRGQLKTPCSPGYYCPAGTGLDLSGFECPLDYFCPSGTSVPTEGSISNDSLNRYLKEDIIDQTLGYSNMIYFGNDRFNVISNHDVQCLAGIEPVHQYRFSKVNINNLNRHQYRAGDTLSSWLGYESTSLKESVQYKMVCSRDNKWQLIKDVISRGDCDCNAQLFVIIALHRLWQCTNRKRVDVCSWPETTSIINMTAGKIPYDGEHIDDGNNGRQIKPSLITGIPFQNAGLLELKNHGPINKPDFQFVVQFNDTHKRIFRDFYHLRNEVTISFSNSTDNNKYIRNLYNAVILIEKHKSELEELVYFRMKKIHENSISALSIQYFDSFNSTFTMIPGRLDVCECSNMLKCPNGTKTVSKGASSLDDCVWNGNEILERASIVTSMPISTKASTARIRNSSDFRELAMSSHQSVATLELHPYEVAVFDIDLSKLSTNMTYSDHYRLAVYKDCKPCPTQYLCNTDGDSCSYPSTAHQMTLLQNCLKKYRHNVCVHKNGTSVDTMWCEEQSNDALANYNIDDGVDFQSEYLVYSEPDLHKCLSIPHFCQEKTWPRLGFRKLCQDELSDGTIGPIYDCVEVQRWKQYLNWKDEVCCSQTSEFGSITACVNNTCSLDARVQIKFEEKLVKDFISVFGYEPRASEPKGRFLMDVGLQEDRHNPDPLSLFMRQDNVLLHNNKPWTVTKGCCDCQPHPLPEFFKNNRRTGGFPDDKHKNLQFTITAINNVDLTIVFELLHGKYSNEFSSMFNELNPNITVHVHKPHRFDSFDQSSTWLNILHEEVFNKLRLDLPLNLPIRRVDGHTNTLLENSILIDQPCESILLQDQRNAFYRGILNNVNMTMAEYDDDGRKDDYNKCIPESSSTVTVHSNWWKSAETAHNNDEKSEFSFISLPYLPFFSSCSNFDSHISLSRLVEEHPDCHLVPPNATKSVYQFGFSKDSNPVSDTCTYESFDKLGQSTISGISLFCQYEEQLAIASDKHRWYEIGPGDTLFHITSDAILTEDFIEKIDDSQGIFQRWGRSRKLFETSKIPVKIDTSHGGLQNVIPRKVVFELQYYQIDKSKKRLVDATIYFYEKCTTLKPTVFGGDPVKLKELRDLDILPCDTDLNGNLKSNKYEMEFLFYPLDWFRLLNRFQFETPVYLFFYTLTGTISILMGALVWTLSYFLTKLRHPPKFHGLSLLKMIGSPSLMGCIISIFSILICLFLSSSCFNMFKDTFSAIKGDWYTNSFMSNEVIRQRNYKGRLGLTLLAFGIYILFSGAWIIIPPKSDDKPNKMQEQEYSTYSSAYGEGLNKMKNENWKPRLWKRANFIWYAIGIQFGLLVLWEFSYSYEFEVFVRQWMILLRLIQIVIEILLSHVLREKLLCAPFMVLIGLTEIFVTMGASDFVDFIIIYFIQVSLTIIHKVHIDPFVKNLQNYYPLLLFRFKRIIKRQARKSVKEKEAEISLLNQINEDIELRKEGVEPLIDVLTQNSIQQIGRYLSPLAFWLVSWFYGSSEIADKYGISHNELGYYTIFALYMVPWSIIVDVFVLNSQELIHGWRLYDYLEYQRHRFYSRQQRWTLDCPNVDESLRETAQSIDSMSFSSQYYFLVSYVAMGMFINLLGMTILLRSEGYNLLGDPVMPIIVVMILILCEVLQRIIIKLGTINIDYLDWQGVWGSVQLEGAMDDLVAAKLTIGEGRQVDLERERMEFEALNDDKFRQRFLDRNRPWILHHLFDLFTGDKTFNSNREMLLDRANSLYKNVSEFQNETRREGLGVDISSDDEDLDKEYLPAWDSLKFEGSNLEIMRMWVQMAKKRQAFRKEIEYQVKNNVSSRCSQCSRDEALCDSMHSCIGWNGKRDPSALTNLIQRFERENTSQQYDFTMWKSFFKQHAEIITLCNYCVNKTEGKHHSRPTRKTQQTRPGDISSDDEDEQPISTSFPPMLVDRDSAHGHLIKKWLDRARLKIGGSFPRPDAQHIAEKYISNMKNQGMNRHTKNNKEVNKLDDKKKADTKTCAHKDFHVVKLDNASKVVMKKWLNEAKQRRNIGKMNK